MRLRCSFATKLNYQTVDVQTMSDAQTTDVRDISILLFRRRSIFVHVVDGAVLTFKPEDSEAKL